MHNALWHASPADIAGMRQQLREMAAAARAQDATAFIHADWRLPARIAATSPNAILRSICLSLLDLIESHTPAVLPAGGQPLPGFLRERYELHCALVEAVAAGDGPATQGLIAEHNMTSPAGSG